MMKRILSFALCLSMLTSILPAFADDAQAAAYDNMDIADAMSMLADGLEQLAENASQLPKAEVGTEAEPEAGSEAETAADLAEELPEETADVQLEIAAKSLHAESGLLYKIVRGECHIIGSEDERTVLVIPEMISGSPVTVIGNYAFEDNEHLTSVTLPSTVVRIGSGAFRDCINLTYTEFGNSLESIDTQAFYGCISLKSVNLPDSVHTIGSRAFGNCSALSYFNWPAALTNADTVFSGCVSLKNVSVPQSVDTIPANMFSESSITGIELPSTLKTIGAYAFEDCSLLAEISIPESVQTIGDYAFSECTKIKRVEFPKGLTQLGSRAFNGCTALQELVLPAGLEKIGSYAFASCTALTLVKIEEGISQLGSYAFADCASLTEVQLPDSMKTIGTHAFQNCVYLETINYPLSLESADKPFSGCTYLTEISVPEGVTYLAKYVFEDSSLSRITLPSTLTHIGSNAFANCDRLQTISLPEGLIQIGSYAFEDCDRLKAVVLPDGIETLGSWCFSSCDKIASVSIPASIVSFGDYAFAGCTALTDIDFQSGLSMIGYRAFSGCSTLAEIVLPDSVTTIGERAFENCISLTSFSYPVYLSKAERIFVGCASLSSVEIPEGVTALPNYLFAESMIISVDLPDTLQRIGSNAFNDCNRLAQIDFPASVTEIGYAAFSDCDVLHAVVLPSSLEVLGNYSFAYCGALSEVVIPASVESFGERVFADCTVLSSVEFQDGLERIGAYAFTGCSSLTNADLPDSVRSIGDYAFQNCSALTTFSFPLSLETAGYIFEGCTSLTEYAVPSGVEAVPAYMFYESSLAKVTLPDTLERIGSYAFAYSLLKEITIPASVTVLNSRAFIGCAELQTVAIPGSIETFGEYGFAYCPALTSVNLTEGLTLIGSYAFAGCTALTTVALPDTLKQIGEYAFQECTALSQMDIPASVSNAYYIFEDCAALKTVTVAEGMETLPGGIFAYSGVSSVTLPSTLKKIGNYSFYDCDQLKGVELPDGLVSIGERAFYSCSALENIVLPSTVESLGDSCFRSCESLTSVTGGYRLTAIDSYSFTDIPALTIYAPADSVLEAHALAMGFTVVNTEAAPPAYIGVNEENVDYTDEATGLVYRIIKGKSWITDNTSTASSIRIPNAINDAPVVGIGNSAFAGSKHLKEIVLPDYLTTIESYAFNNCSVLASVTFNEGLTTIESYGFKGCPLLKQVDLPDSVTSIGYEAFADCVNLTAFTYPANLSGASSIFARSISLKTVAIPEGVTVIPDSMFANSCITSITLPTTLKQIADDAFSNCDLLGEIVIPEGVETIGNDAFYDCDTLSAVTIPSTVTTFGSYAFKSCNVLCDVTFADGLTKIGYEAFAGCTSLETAALPDSVKEIGYHAFADCTYLMEFDYPLSLVSTGGSPLSGCNALKTVTIPEGITAIPEAMFANSSITSITLPSTLKQIEDDAFYNCDRLKEIVIPEGVESIGNEVFYDCDALTAVTLPSTIKSFGNYAFKYCSVLSDVTFADGLTKIGYEAFASCTSLETAALPDSVKEIGYHAFADCTSLVSIEYPISLVSTGGSPLHGCTALTTVIIPEGTTTIPEALFANSHITAIVLPSTLKQIEGDAFYNCDRLKEIVIPEGVESIGDEAFYDCDALTAVTLPSTIKSFGNYAFKYCSVLSDVTFAEGLTKIGYEAFASCTSLETAALPDSVKEIGYHAFADCTSLATFDYPRSLAETGGSPLSGCTALTTVALPEGITAIPGAMFANSHITAIELPATLKQIEDDAFYNCDRLKEIVIPEGVESIGTEAFYGCDALTAVTLPSTIKSFGNYAFKYCSALSDVTFADGLTKIGYEAFVGCAALEAAALPDSVREIGYHAFADCTSLASFDYPLNLTSTGGSPLSGCTSLKTVAVPMGITAIPEALFANSCIVSVTLPATLKQIEDDAFYNCDQLQSIVIPDGVKTIGNSAFQSCGALVDVALPDSLETIGSSAFRNCIKLEEIRLPENLENLNDYAFEGCTSLVSVVLPEMLYTLNYHTFNGCTSLEAVTGSYMLTNISSPFGNCGQLTIYAPACSHLAAYAIANNIPLVTQELEKPEYLDSALLEDKTYLKVNTNSVSVNGCVGVELHYEFDPARFDYVDSIRLNLNTVTGLVPMEETLYLNGEMLHNYTLDDQDLIIYVEEATGTLNLYYQMEEQTDLYIVGTVKYRCDGEQYNDIVDITNEFRESISLETSELVSQRTIAVSGVAPADADVTILIDDREAASVSANKVGRYQASVTLPDPEDGKSYFVKVQCTGSDGMPLTATKLVTYAERMASLKDFTMHYRGHSYELTDTQSPAITFASGNEMTFTVTVENPDMLKKVYIVSTRNNNRSVMEAFWDEERGQFVASGFFDDDPSYVPGTLGVQFIRRIDIPEVSGEAVIPDANIQEYIQVEQTSNGENSYNFSISMLEDDKTTVQYQENLGFSYNMEAEIPLERIKDVARSHMSYSMTSEQINIILETCDSVDSVLDAMIGVSPLDGKTGYVKIANTALDYLVPGKNGEKFLLSLDYSDPTTYTMMLYDIADVSSQVYSLQIAKSAADLFDPKAMSLQGTILFDGLKGIVKTVEYNLERDELMRMVDQSTQITDKARAKSEINAAATGLMCMRGGIVLLGMAAGCAALVVGGPVAIGLGIASSVLANAGANLVDLLWEMTKADILAGRFNAHWAIDPSGFIYEAFEDNRVQGAIVSAYWVAYDPEDPTFWDAEPEEGAGVLWDAGPWDQLNPITTDVDGKYAWDVPEGWWQVRVSKDGYEDANSAWMSVAPPRTGVNIELVSLAAPELLMTTVTEDGVLLSFDKYVQTESLNGISVSAPDGTAVTYTLSAETAEDAQGNEIAKDIMLTFDADAEAQIGTYVISWTAEQLVSYAGISAEANTAESYYSGVREMSIPESAAVYRGGMLDIPLAIANYAADDTVLLSGYDENLIEVTLGDFDEQGNAAIQVKPLLQGSTMITVTLNNSHIKAELPVTVRSAEAATGDAAAFSLHGWYESDDDRTVFVQIQSNEAENLLLICTEGSMYAMNSFVAAEAEAQDTDTALVELSLTNDEYCLMLWEKDTYIPATDSVLMLCGAE